MERPGAGAPSGLQNRHAVVARRWVGSIPAPLRFESPGTFTGATSACVLALANPGATLAALITVAGIWAVAYGVMRVVLAFEVKRLPSYVDQAFAAPTSNGVARDRKATPART